MALRFEGPASGVGVSLWWLGQSGFVLAAPGVRLALDPYLSPRPDRRLPPPCPPEDLASLDAILVTHEHIDHMDLPTLAAATRGAEGPLVVLPEPVVDQAVRAGVPRERIRGVQPDRVLHVGSSGRAEVLPLPACHGLESPPAKYDFGRDESGGLVRYLGYVVRLGGVTLFHSGDAVVYDGLADRLRAEGVQVALLPINGRDYFREARNIVGNMTDREAADLCALAGIDTLVPMHYDMFPSNLGDPGRLVDYVRQAHPELTVVVPAPARGVTLAPVHRPAP